MMNEENQSRSLSLNPEDSTSLLTSSTLLFKSKGGLGYFSLECHRQKDEQVLLGQQTSVLAPLTSDPVLMGG